MTLRVAVLTVSDRCSLGEATDESGPAVAALCREKLGAQIVASAGVPDERGAISAALAAWVAQGIDLVLTTGGTGMSPRDVTPEAALSVIERPAPGLMELARARCLAKTPLAFLSRGVAGVAERTLIVTLPGSPRGACEQLGALLDVLPHAVAQVRGQGGHP
ncbi:MAG: MogA/MoaB family molybdenum cofactor biosynthesis protein [Phycisphaerales bacterium]|nr:MogA/MoaB family molybdenum cofactor biosynthesis protein [Phycisphaerales bacterium]